MSNGLNFNRKDLEFLIALKVAEFKKDDLIIDSNMIKEYLFKRKWQKRSKLPMCDLIDDIMNLEFKEVYDYLSVNAIKEASHLDLSDFKELVGN